MRVSVVQAGETLIVRCVYETISTMTTRRMGFSYDDQ